MGDEAMTKPGKLRIKAKQRLSQQAKASPAVKTDASDDEDVDALLAKVRVRTRDTAARPTNAGEAAGGSGTGMGKLLRDASPAAAAAAHNIKESIKRPLSSLLRRPGSRNKRRGSSQGPPEYPKQEDPAMLDDEVENVILNETELNQLESSLNNYKNGSPAKATEAFTANSMDNGGSLAERRGAATYDSTAPVQVFESGGAGGTMGGSGRISHSPTPEIPTLEDLTDANDEGEVARVPRVTIDRAAAFHELDSALLKHAGFSTLGDIDLSLLSRFLCAEADVRDEVSPWTWDYVYTSLCGQLRTGTTDGTDGAEQTNRPDGGAADEADSDPDRLQVPMPPIKPSPRTK